MVNLLEVPSTIIKRNGYEVRFYAHEDWNKYFPSTSLAQSFRRWLVLVVSPEYCHVICFEGESIAVEYNYDYRREGTALYMVPDSFIERLKWRIGMMLAVFFPRKYRNCVTEVEAVVLGTRTVGVPDDLYELLKGIDTEG